jgi:protein-S-isoprenylcysteine O-methyltransferase Ste14
MPLLLPITLGAWAAIEGFLLLRDLARAKGSTRRDRGTRGLMVVSWFLAFAVASLVAGPLSQDPAWHLGRWHAGAGIVVMWIGLVVRIWAVVALGSSFRTTVEVDAGQAVVDRGPYRWVRHPSYDGILLIAIGYGIALGNWLSLALVLLIAAPATLRRIVVEEAELACVIGEPYVEYRRRTKRLVPGLW